MSTKNKVFFLIITLFILLIAITSAGCINQPAAEKMPQLIIAVNAESGPYVFYDENGTLCGIDIDIAKAICNEIGAEPVFDVIPFRGILPAVESGDIDMGIAGITKTEERAKTVDFSDTYAYDWQGILYNPANGVNISTPDELSGKIIGVKIGTTGEALVNARYGDKAKKIVKYEWIDNAINDLKSGDIDCVVFDKALIASIVKQNPQFKSIDDKSSLEEYGIAVKKGNTGLLNKINAALQKFFVDGTLEKIKLKYLDS